MTNWSRDDKRHMLCSILVLKILQIENKEQGVFLTVLISNTASQKQIRNNSLEQGKVGNPSHNHNEDKTLSDVKNANKKKAYHFP